MRLFKNPVIFGIFISTRQELFIMVSTDQHHLQLTDFLRVRSEVWVVINQKPKWSSHHPDQPSDMALFPLLGTAAFRSRMDVLQPGPWDWSKLSPSGFYPPSFTPSWSWTADAKPGPLALVWEEAEDHLSPRALRGMGCNHTTAWPLLFYPISLSWLPLHRCSPWEHPVKPCAYTSLSQSPDPIFFCFFFLTLVSLTESWYIAQTDLEFVFLLLQPPKCWNYRCTMTWITSSLTRKLTEQCSRWLGKNMKLFFKISFASFWIFFFLTEVGNRS